MKVTSTTRNVRMSPKKVREVTRQIQGMPVAQAQAVLSAIPRKSARLVAQTLATAIADAEHIRTEWSEDEIMDKAGKIRERIQDHTSEQGKLQHKFRHLKGELTRYEEYLDSDHKLAEDKLVIHQATAGSGRPLRRWRTRARGGGSPIIKRTSHIRITLSDE
jgi:ribosomal protein L22